MAPLVTPPARPARPRYHYLVHGPLVTYIVVTVLLALGAFNSNNNLLFWLFGLALALLIVSGVLSGAMLMGVRVRRQGVLTDHAGRPIAIRYEVQNVNRRVPLFALGISEESPTHAADVLEAPMLAFVPHVPAGETRTVESLTPTRRRGEVQLSEVRVTSDFPFGLVRKSLGFQLPGRAIIWPERIDIPPDALRAMRGLRGGREDESRIGPSPGGDEFLTVREYRPGDSPRLIAWRATARREGRELHPWPMVRQMGAAPRAQHRAVVVLRCDEARESEAYEQAIAVAASLIEHAGAQGLAVGLEVPSLGRSITPDRGRRHASGLIDELALLPRFGEAQARPTTAAPVAAEGPDVVRLVVGANGLVDTVEVQRPRVPSGPPTRGRSPRGATR